MHISFHFFEEWKSLGQMFNFLRDYQTSTVAVCFPSSLALNKSSDVSTTSLPVLTVTWPFDYSHTSLWGGISLWFDLHFSNE